MKRQEEGEQLVSERVVEGGGVSNRILAGNRRGSSSGEQGGDANRKNLTNHHSGRGKGRGPGIGTNALFS